MRSIAAFLCVALAASRLVSGQDLDAARNDQIGRLETYLLDAIQPSGLVRDSLVLSGASFHPASPDAAGFALLGLSALDHVGALGDAEQRVLAILSAHTGNTPGVNPGRSADGHFLHWMNLSTGAQASGGWPVEYATISSALLVSGAQFASRHFSENAAIGALAEELTNSVDFDAAIHPSLDGRIHLTMNASGGGAGGAARPWNEYMLVESLALRQADNDRALAIQDKWLDVDNLPQRTFLGKPTLTDNPNLFAPAFWVQQMHFFNGDFRHDEEFESIFESHRQADQQYSNVVLGESFRYGLTAGVSPQGYNADRIDEAPSSPPSRHPNDVFSPEAVAAWGDMDGFLEFYNSQFPTTDPRYRYGLLRESALQPGWVPNDAGLVDHLFLLFGLIESIDGDFFADRLFARYVPGDFTADGEVSGVDFVAWQRGFGDLYDASDLADFAANFGGAAGAEPAAAVVPEPNAGLLLWLLVGGALLRRHICTTARCSRPSSLSGMIARSSRISQAAPSSRADVTPVSRPALLSITIE